MLYVPPPATHALNTRMHWAACTQWHNILGSCQLNSCPLMWEQLKIPVKQHNRSCPATPSRCMSKYPTTACVSAWHATVQHMPWQQHARLVCTPLIQQVTALTLTPAPALHHFSMQSNKARHTIALQRPPASRPPAPPPLQRASCQQQQIKQKHKEWFTPTTCCGKCQSSGLKTLQALAPGVCLAAHHTMVCEQQRIHSSVTQGQRASIHTQVLQPQSLPLREKGGQPLATGWTAVLSGAGLGRHASSRTSHGASHTLRQPARGDTL